MGCLRKFKMSFKVELFKFLRSASFTLYFFHINIFNRICEKTVKNNFSHICSMRVTVSTRFNYILEKIFLFADDACCVLFVFHKGV